MDLAERGVCVEECDRPRSWWETLNWRRICLYFGIAIVLYDFCYCIIIYFYIKALNRSPEFRLVVYKSNYRFMKLYYTLHYYFGDASLLDEDTSRWQQHGDL
ncbi:uncharacterized protein LOC129000605 [Macrosteles quadrilineatus]|uniref:uncharacterized protein LOC129000605 n=1 Tax=Macrosteles quadrilineatus TaxID=74068 RepID=UPI0023E347A1|nr:uncharacterized protein LOC129000605 [Macrosteles quadrilineatus]